MTEGTAWEFAFGTFRGLASRVRRAPRSYEAWQEVPNTAPPSGVGDVLTGQDDGARDDGVRPSPALTELDLDLGMEVH